MNTIKLILINLIILCNCLHAQEKTTTSDGLRINTRFDASFVALNGLTFNTRPRMDLTVGFVKNNSLYFGLGLFEYNLRKLKSFDTIGPLEEYYGYKSFWHLYLETPLAYDFNHLLKLKKSHISLELCPQFLIAAKAVWIKIYDPSYPNSNFIRFKDNNDYYGFKPRFNIKSSIRYNYDLTNRITIGLHAFIRWFKIAPEFTKDNWSYFSLSSNYKQNRDFRMGISLTYHFKKTTIKKNL